MQIIIQKVWKVLQAFFAVFFFLLLFFLPAARKVHVGQQQSCGVGSVCDMHGHPVSPDFMKMCYTSQNTDNPSMESQPLANSHQTRVTAAIHPESFRRLPGSQSELSRSSRMEDTGSERQQRNSGQHVKHGLREAVYSFSTFRQSVAHLRWIPLQGQTRKLLSFIQGFSQKYTITVKTCIFCDIHWFCDVIHACLHMLEVQS